ncbi:hypothetical protein PVE_R2G0108 [Pseudomonas veronii 1YdBTEX2]|uniref:Uncharacterized protein n=1 Tax=Pseudomonas veronii 1YdBTEX2 TaxID=1295141 RepID=A0A1D3K726_PSEVE|nr:hypothetical protein PVE_R2G0108 [Pseudomonas veronii 1YdBTEX2]
MPIEKYRHAQAEIRPKLAAQIDQVTYIKLAKRHGLSGHLVDQALLVRGMAL